MRCTRDVGRTEGRLKPVLYYSAMEGTREWFLEKESMGRNSAHCCSLL